MQSFTETGCNKQEISMALLHLLWNTHALQIMHVECSYDQSAPILVMLLCYRQPCTLIVDSNVYIHSLFLAESGKGNMILWTTHSCERMSKGICRQVRKVSRPYRVPHQNGVSQA